MKTAFNTIKMDELEKILFDRRDEIQNDEPHEGHFERFEMKLNAKPKSKMRYLQIASSVAAVLVLALIVVNYFKPEQEAVCLREISPEYAEVENYYINTINSEEAKLVKFIKHTNDDGVTQQMLNEELASFEEQYQQLCNDMKSNPGDERIVNAMINYYQTKLGVITQILLKLEENKITNKDHENDKNVKL